MKDLVQGFFFFFKISQMDLHSLTESSTATPSPPWAPRGIHQTLTQREGDVVTHAQQLPKVHLFLRGMNAKLCHSVMESPESHQEMPSRKHYTRRTDSELEGP